MSNWKQYHLRQLIEVQNGYAFKSEELNAHGIPVIKIKNIQPPNISFEDADCYPHEINDRLKQFVIKKKDILISMTGSHVSQFASAVGKVGRYGFDNPALLNQRVGRLYSKDKSKLNEDFLYYLIARPEVQFELATNAGGSANQANISPQLIKDLEFSIPDIETQTRIASILSALDDKIELNRRTNHTLEQMAQTLFKKYYVTGIDPDNLPEGWKKMEIGNIISVKDGTHDSPKQKESGYFLITSKHIKGSKIDFEQAYYISETDYNEINKRSRVDSYDILITMIGTVGVLHLVLEENINFAIKNIGLFKSSERIDLFEYLFLYLNSSYIKEYLEARTSGSTQQYLTLDTLRKIPVIIPHDDVLTEFKTMVNPIIMQIKSNDNESLYLSKIRDTLLPKLMSGEITVN